MHLITSIKEVPVLTSFTVTIPTSLTKTSLVGTFAFPRKWRWLHFLPAPLLETIGNPIFVGIIELGLAESLALLTSLMVDSCVVFLSMVQSDSDGNFLARPATRLTSRVVASKVAHYIRIVVFNAAFVFVAGMEAEMDVLILK